MKFNTCKIWIVRIFGAATIFFMKEFSCFLNVPPKAKGRPRFSKAGFAYTPKATRDGEAAIRYFLLQHKPPKFEGPIFLSIRFDLSKPKSAKKRMYPSVRPDIDNLTKSVLDAANGILFEDDGQIVALHVEKVYAKEEGIFILCVHML